MQLRPALICPCRRYGHTRRLTILTAAGWVVQRRQTSGLRRVLRPGGLLLMVTSDGTGPGARFLRPAGVTCSSNTWCCSAAKECGSRSRRRGPARSAPGLPGSGPTSTCWSVTPRYIDTWPLGVSYACWAGCCRCSFSAERSRSTSGNSTWLLAGRRMPMVVPRDRLQQRADPLGSSPVGTRCCPCRRVPTSPDAPRPSPRRSNRTWRFPARLQGSCRFL